MTNTLTFSLTFSSGNEKLVHTARLHGLKRSQITSFDLPAGYTCPAADSCKSFANRDTGKITDGENCKFRCYAASLEARYPASRKAHWRNYEALQKLSLGGMVKLISTSIPKNTKILRIHATGDFFSKRYFQAWVKVAELHPDIKFFGYTKILPYVKAEKPANFKLQYSYGGLFDKYVKDEPTTFVVKNIAEALEKNLFVACQENPADDYGLIQQGKTFAILVHGTQPAKLRG